METKEETKLAVESVKIKWMYDENPMLDYLENEYEIDYPERFCGLDYNDLLDAENEFDGLPEEDRIEDGGILRITSSCAYEEKDYTGEDAKEHFKYLQQDKHRLDTFGNYWWLMGCVAEVTLEYPIMETSLRLESLSSGGLWGIESDGPEDGYKEDIQKEQYRDLVEHVKTLGINVEMPDYNDVEVVEGE